jgi:hypothetical protein
VTVDLNYTLSPVDDELGLYLSADFANPAAIIDYVEWGSSGHTRSTVAVAALIWTSGDFVPSWNDCESLEYDGSGDSSGDWDGQDVPTMPCLDNSFDGCEAMMPIELLSFTARPSRSGTRINWEAIHDPTASKVFLEHSLDKEHWTFATTWIPSGPEFDHGTFDHVVQVPGIQYYRLLIAYQDGATEYSPIEAVKACTDEAGVLVSPNPATNKLDVVILDSGLTAPVEVILTDTHGRIVSKTTADATVQFDISGIPDGVYIVQIPLLGIAQRVLKQ